LQFVVKITFFNRIARGHAAIAGTVITFLASISNLGGMLPGTWVPLLTEAIGLDAAASFCVCSGVLVLASFWRKLRQIEVIDAGGW